MENKIIHFEGPQVCQLLLWPGHPFGSKVKTPPHSNPLSQNPQPLTLQEQKNFWNTQPLGRLIRLRNRPISRNRLRIKPFSPPQPLGWSRWEATYSPRGSESSFKISQRRVPRCKKRFYKSFYWTLWIYVLCDNCPIQQKAAFYIKPMKLMLLLNDAAFTDLLGRKNLYFMMWKYCDTLCPNSILNLVSCKHIGWV